MKFHELKDPTCTRCKAGPLTAYSSVCDAEGEALEVLCVACRDAADLAQWEVDKRLRSNLTLAAALKAQSRPVECTFAPRFRPPHPWEPEVMFLKGGGKGDGGSVVLRATLYSPRSPDFRGPVAMTAAARTLTEMREFAGGREFALYDGGRAVGSGAVKPWDLRWLDVAEASERVHAAVKATLEPVVWFGGLQAIVQRATLRGLKGSAETAVGRVELTTYSSAGRCLVQIETPTDRVTAITAEDEAGRVMGVQGVDAAEDAAVAMLCSVAAAWRGGAFKMVESKGVGFG